MKAPVFKAILGYDIAEGMSVEQYDEWLWTVHYPDLLSNPHLDRIVLNHVVQPIESTSAGTPISGAKLPLRRIAELHFADASAYAAYLEWFEENPIAIERSPKGRTEFIFYLLCQVTEVVRE